MQKPLKTKSITCIVKIYMYFLKISKVSHINYISYYFAYYCKLMYIFAAYTAKKKSPVAKMELHWFLHRASCSNQHVQGASVIS